MDTSLIVKAQSWEFPPTQVSGHAVRKRSETQACANPSTGVYFLSMRSGNISTRLNVSLGETVLVGKIVREFGQWHDIPEDALFVVNLSLDELVTNIVTHSQKQPPPPQEIVLRLSTVKNEVRAEVEDDGCAFNPLSMPTPDIDAPLQERDPGGLGIHLVRCLMDSVNYQRIGARNRLTISKKVA
jgi:serine/threonine-protein kinase RsbW